MEIPETFRQKKGSEEKLEELLDSKKRAFKYAPKHNKLKIGNEQVQYFLDLWCEQAFTSDDDQKDLVAKSYCFHVLGVSKEIFEKFKMNHIKAYHIVGLRQSGIKRKEDLGAFWYDMKKIFPRDYTGEDIDYLIKSGSAAPFQLINQLQTHGPTDLLLKLRTNAHVYK